MGENIQIANPRFMKPLDDLFLALINKTEVRPARFSLPEFVVEFNIQIRFDHPPPNKPFSIVINDPFFGLIQFPVSFPTPPAHRSRNRRSKKKWKKHPKQENATQGSMLPMQSTQINKPEPLEKSFETHLFEKPILEYKLSQFKVYFMCLEQKINKRLKDVTNLSLGYEKIEELKKMSEQLMKLIAGVEWCCSQIDMDMRKVEDSKPFQEILNCTKRLQTILQNLKTSDLPALLEDCNNKKRTPLLCNSWLRRGCCRFPFRSRCRY